MLGMDLVARDESGAPIDPKKTGVMHLYKTVGCHCVQCTPCSMAHPSAIS